MKRGIPVFLLILFVTFLAFPQKKEAKKINYKEVFTIDTNEIKADMKFLASDELEGRETAERGQKIAALYLKTQYERIGLNPINKSYYQQFDILKINPPQKPELVIKVKTDKIISGEFKKDFFPYSSGESVQKIDAPAVFVGYGITSPEDNYDDYKNIDVKNKIAIILVNSPGEKDDKSPFAGIKKSAPYKNYNLKLENAIKHGAAGVLYMMESGNKTLGTYIRSFGRLIDKPNYQLFKPPDKSSVPFAYITEEFCNSILQGSKTTVEQLKKKIDSAYIPHSFEIQDISISFSPNIKRQILQTENVVGYIEGSDPELKKQYVVVSAHYDHLGKSKDGGVFNGADDNASGTVGILNIAKSLVKNKYKPLRSILFIAFTGEEKGLFGSSYYSDNPLIPFNETCINLNIDMIGRIVEPYPENGIKDYIYLIGPKIIGGDLLNLSESANNESVRLKLDYKFDTVKDPEILYRRSDHYNFAKHGIPAIFYYNGEHSDYHKVTDRVEKIDFGAMYKRIELIGYSTWKFANFKDKIKTERAFP